MSIEAFSVPIDKTSLDLQTESAVDDSANRRGREVQHGLSKLLGDLNYVAWVRETEKDSPEDMDKIDLVVGLDQSQIDVVIPEVFVQAKASTTGVVTFKRKVTGMLKKEGIIETMRRDEWMLANRIILLVGDLRISRSRKNRWPVKNEEIIDSFETQLKKIDDYERRKIVTSSG
jgi:hypothetical protein